MKLPNPADQSDYDQIIRQACNEASGTGERVALIAHYIDDAVQAHRPWATTVQIDAQMAGYSRDLKSWLKRSRVLVVLDGRTVSKPTVLGARRRDAGGIEFALQLDIAVMTFREIRDKALEASRIAKTYTDSRRYLDAVFALADRVPNADTPAEALSMLGISLDDWLGSAAA